MVLYWPSLITATDIRIRAINRQYADYQNFTKQLSINDSKVHGAIAVIEHWKHNMLLEALKGYATYEK